MFPCLFMKEIMSKKVYIIVALAVIGLTACSPRIVEHIVYQRDTTQIVKIDSIWQYQHDSVFVKERGDTVYKYVEHIRYRDRFKIDTLVRVHEVHDTTTVEKLVEKQLTKAQRAKLDSYWWLIAVIAGLLVWIFRKPIITLVRRLL